MRIGFIGLGLMGAGMAANLIKAGHEVSVPARRILQEAPATCTAGRHQGRAQNAARVHLRDEVIGAAFSRPMRRIDVIRSSRGVPSTRLPTVRGKYTLLAAVAALVLAASSPLLAQQTDPTSAAGAPPPPAREGNIWDH
ncbi:MAG: NAD(P)-binding domain-containing protein [Stellaceae bacterium]